MRSEAKKIPTIFFAALIPVFSSSVLPAWAKQCPPSVQQAEVREPKEELVLYEQGHLVFGANEWLLERRDHVSPVARLINHCSNRFVAETLTDSLPERLNVFAFLPQESRSNAFIAVSSVDQKMAMQKLGPYWHAYFIAFPDLRFVSSQVRVGLGVVSKDRSIKKPNDLAGKTIGLIPRPSSLRVLAEIFLMLPWSIDHEVDFRELSPNSNMEEALESGEVDALFMPVALYRDGRMVRQHLPLGRKDFHWLSISDQDVEAVVRNSPVLTERITIKPPNGATNGEESVGLITFDVAFFAFAQTSDQVVYEFLKAARYGCPQNARRCNALSVDAMLLWPEIDADLIHPGALKFYREHGRFGN